MVKHSNLVNIDLQNYTKLKSVEHWAAWNLQQNHKVLKHSLTFSTRLPCVSFKTSLTHRVKIDLSWR